MAITKRSGDGKDYPASAYAYVPDRSKPSTWKIRIKAYEGGVLKVTKRQLGLAAAAFSPGGFRGKQVQLPAEAKAAVKRRLRGLYRSMGVSADNIPRYLREHIGWRNGDILYEGVMREEFSSVVFDDAKVKEGQVRFDKETGVMRNLAILSLESANRRRYVKEAVQAAVNRGVYEGLPCYIDHSDKRTGRAFRELAGKWMNTRWDPATNQVRADLQTLKKHREDLFDVAENAPELAAPSHVIWGKSVKEKDANGEWIEKVTHIAKGKSVDIVTDAATVKSMKEGVTMKTIHDLTLEDLKETRPELYEQIIDEALDGKTGDGDPGEGAKNVDYKALFEAEKTKRETAEKTAAVQGTQAMLKEELAKEENLGYLPESVHPRILKMVEGRVLTKEQVAEFVKEHVDHAKALGVKPEKKEKKLSESKIPNEKEKGEGKETKRELLAETFVAMADGSEPFKEKKKDKE